MDFFGNKGEWSEIYTFLKCLADGKLYAIDGDLNQIDDIYYNVLEVIREEKNSPEYTYKRTKKIIRIVNSNNEEIKSFTVQSFEEISKELFSKIKNIKGKSNNNEIPFITPLLNDLKVKSLKAPSQSKSDITIKIHDIFTNSNIVLDFSIKSQIGSPSTLLNASKATNFDFLLETELTDNEINLINSTAPFKDRISKIKEKTTLKYNSCQNKIFEKNMKMIDSLLPKRLAEFLLISKEKGISNIDELVESIEDWEPFDDKNIFVHKIKQLLMASALGMVPSKEWNGNDDATGGYIIVKDDGRLGCYHLYNRNALKEYLYKNTKFENGSETRHDFGKVKSINGIQFFTLNLQIRFRK